MKTAMQNHIADMKKIQEMVKSKNLDKDLEVTILESIEGCIENAESFLEAEKEQMINFHIEVMKEGLIEEGDKKWSDGYLPKISKTAEQYYTKTFKSDE